MKGIVILIGNILVLKRRQTDVFRNYFESKEGLFCIAKLYILLIVHHVMILGK